MHNVKDRKNVAHTGIHMRIKATHEMRCVYV